MISMKIENLRKTLLCEVSQCVRDAGVLTKVFGVSERSRCVLIGTSAPNIANISSHHVIFSTFHQLALFSGVDPILNGVGVGRARNAGRSAQDPRTTPGWLPRVRLHSPCPTETESVVCRPMTSRESVNGLVRTWKQCRQLTSL